ncbi:MAG TPA: glycosyltransferase family 4 protein [Anaerolineaceae bacterium]|nr:glycosyltransferase family 4 protein [Anaerolineaceae bacterium]
MSQTFRIAMIHYAGPPAVGGVESTIYHHARLLAARGHRVTVIAGRFGEHTGEDYLPGVTFHCVPPIDSRHPAVEAVNRALAQGDAGEPFNRLRDELAAALRPLLQECEVVLAHNVMTLHKNLALTAALHDLARRGEVRLIAWAHDFAWQDPLYTPDLHPGYPWDLLKQPWPNTAYVAVSEHRRGLLAQMLGLPVEQIGVATPGVDAVEFLDLQSTTRRLTDQLGLLAAEPLALLPARLTRRKNVEFALRVMAALRARRPAAALVITGPPGPHNPANAAYLASLQALRADLQMEGAVHFLYELGEGGEPLLLSDQEVAELYRLADLLLFPSRMEGFGIPVLEAGLARLPVFAADIPPVRESAADLAVRFDPEGDPETVAAAIDEFLHGDTAYRLKRRVLERFTWDAIIDRVVLPVIEARVQP